MEISQFKQFVAIAECGTMREAAERLYVTQPTLSYNLKKLETELGCKLFTRVHNRLELTSYGEIVIKHSNIMTEQMEEMLSEIATQKCLEEGTIRIGCFSKVFSSFAMAQIAAELPNIRFEAQEAAVPDLLEGLEEGRFHAIALPGPISKRGTFSESLYEEQAFVSVPKDAQLAKLPSAPLSALNGLEFQIEGGQFGYTDWFRAILEEAQVASENITEVSFNEHLRTKDQIEKANFITSFILEFVKVYEKRTIVPVEAKSAKRTVHLVWNKDGFEQAKPVIDYVHANKERLFSGNAYFAHIMFPDDSSNLHIISSH